jgi:hypothetical protein
MRREEIEMREEDTGNNDTYKSKTMNVVMQEEEDCARSARWIYAVRYGYEKPMRRPSANR